MGTTHRDRIAGSLLGTAVGDALGLPREGLSPARARALFGDELRHAFLFGRGMVSDDTEHTCLVAQALLASAVDEDQFAASLGWKLRLWMLLLPAGVGLGTARAIGKLWLGFGPERSGVHSAGNGPAIRAAILGVTCADEPDLRRRLVRAASRTTHTDERATRAAQLVAFAAAFAAKRDPDQVEAREFLRAAEADLGDPDDELRELLKAMRAHIDRGAPIQEFAASLGLERGVTGYAYHSVPVALYGWLTNPTDLRQAVSDVVRLGGDADTTGAIVGGIAGAGVGATGIPRDWIEGLCEWPRSVAWMNALADRLAAWESSRASQTQAPSELPLFWPAILPRNLLFLVVVLGHGLRRLFPPYAGSSSSPPQTVEAHA